MSKWKVSDADTFFEVYRDEQTHSYSLLSESEAHRLARELGELEALREERRWRKIGEEWPGNQQECQLANAEFTSSRVFTWCSDDGTWRDSGGEYADESGYYDRADVTFTHWRPAPMDVPKEEE